MKKYKLILILNIIVLLTAACQPTPEEKVINGKNQSAMLSAAIQSSGRNKLSEIKVPDKYKFSKTDADEKLKITVDASVVLPDSKKLPTVKVIPAGFTQEMVSGMLDYLFRDKPYYLTDNSAVMTKGEIESAIVSMQASINDGTYSNDPEMQAMIEQQIKTLKEKYSNAPETRNEPILSDGIMTVDPETGANTISVHSISLNSIDGGACFNCNSSTDTSINADTSQLSFSDFSKEEYSSDFGCKSIDIYIDKVELGLLRIKQQDTEGTKSGVYVPVWAFYGTVANLYSGGGNEHILYNGGCEFPDGPYIVFAINAIDGSIIDIEHGY